MQLQIASPDVCEIADIPMSTLQRWVTKGFVCNVDRRDDVNRKYTLMQLLAVTYANRWRALGIRQVGNIVKYVANMKPNDLMQALNEGRTFLFPVPGHEHLVQPPNLPTVSRQDRITYNELNLETCLGYVQRKVKELVPDHAGNGHA